jgi:general secretion pathway protein K
MMARERGSVLPLVLMIVAVVFTISLAFSLMIQSRIERTELLFQRLEAHLQAFSGLQIGLHLFLSGRPVSTEILTSKYTRFPEGTRYLLDGTPATVAALGDRVKLSFQSEAGLINLRMLHLPLLDGLLKTVGMEEKNRRIFLDSLLDWQDEDDFVRLNGAEKDYYEKFGYAPRNDLLLSLDELLLIRGSDEFIYEKIKPFLILGTAEGLNPNVAPYEVLMALPNMTPLAARGIISFRKTHSISSLADLQSVTGFDYNLYENLFSFLAGTSVVIKSVSELGENMHLSLECFVSKQWGLRLNPRDAGLVAMGEALPADVVGRQHPIPFNLKFWKEHIE